jgi:hypothetical protein
MKIKTNILLYSLLTLINLATCFYFVGFGNTGTIIILFVMFILNHYLLVDGAIALLDDNGNKIKGLIYLLGKFFVLIFAFWFAMRNANDFIYIFIASYIFQLIILSISIKSDTKKN